jgi:cytochrome c oxidase cbb3-type subunit 4
VSALLSDLDLVSLLGSLTTVVAFTAFVAIALWAWSGRRKSAFEAAANAPFALPDEADAPHDGTPT